MYYVYVLRSLKDGNLYIGQTSNLEKRLQYHNSGRVNSTKRRLPFQLVYTEEFDSRGDAIRREKILKDIKNKYFKKSLRSISSAG
jgi:putative endonuclease